MFLETFTMARLSRCVLKCLERYSSNGIPNTCGEKKDIENRVFDSFNTHLRLLNSDFSILKKRQKLVFFKHTPLLKKGAFTIPAGQEVTLSAQGAGLAYFIRARGDFTLIFEYSGEGSAVEFSFGDSVFHELSGNISDCTGHISITLCADTESYIDSFVLYGDFPAGALICDAGYSREALPARCERVISISDRNGRTVPGYIFDIDCKQGHITVMQEHTCEYILEYLEAFPEFSEADEEVLLPRGIFDALCYMCAADLCPSCDGEVYSKLTYKYREILENFYDKTRNFSAGRNSFYGVVRKRGVLKMRR